MEKYLCGAEETLRSLQEPLIEGLGVSRVFEGSPSPNLGLISLNKERMANGASALV